MNKKFIWLSAIALTLMIGEPSFASSVDSINSKPCNCHHNSQRLSEKINLTDAQKAKIKAIKAQEHNNLRANYQQLKALRKLMNALSASDKVDEAKLDSLISQRNKIKGAMIKNQVMMQNQIYNILTAQQKAQYQELMKKRAAKHS